MKNFVFDGLSYAKSVIDDHNIDENNVNEHIMQLAKYNFYVNNMDDATNYRSIVEYLQRYWSLFAEPDYEQKIDDCIKLIKKLPIKDIDSIKITKKELDFIGKLDNIRLEKIAFVMLCIAKYHCYYHYEPKYWICYPLNTISKLARVHVTKSENLELFRELVLAGAIESSSYGRDLYEHVLFVSDDINDKIALELSEVDYLELAYTYLFYKNGFSGYVHCEKCGRLVKKKSNRQKFCKDCAEKNHREQKTECERKRRKSGHLETSVEVS